MAYFSGTYGSPGFQQDRMPSGGVVHFSGVREWERTFVPSLNHSAGVLVELDIFFAGLSLQLFGPW